MQTCLPATYELVLKPLDVSALPAHLSALYRDDPLFHEWVHVCDRTRRAEKVSSWTQWSALEQAVYDSGDTASFSRLRGYTDADIADFQRYLELSELLDTAHGDDDFTFFAGVDLLALTRTPEFDALEAELAQMSDAAVAARGTVDSATTDIAADID
jgi:hypothetical protein